MNESWDLKVAPGPQLFYLGLLVGTDLGAIGSCRYRISRPHGEGWRTTSRHEPVVQPIVRSVKRLERFSVSGGGKRVGKIGQPIGGL